jgi:Glucodextranase, domain B
MSGMGALAVAASTLTALAFTGCGSTSSPRVVGLTVTAPTGGSEIAVGNVRVFGTVIPTSAVVVVAGKRVHVANGSFARWISVRRGVNRIEIAAKAPGYTSASTNVEVSSSLCATSAGAKLAGCKRSRQRSSEGGSA